MTARRPEDVPHPASRIPVPSSLVQLVLTRLREFLREPEAVFWAFVFPLLLATALGIAFRTRAPDRLRVGVVTGTAEGAAVAAALRAARGVTVVEVGDSAGRADLRTGRLTLVVVPRGPGGVEYRYDDAREEGRAARLVVDDAVQRAAGRRDPVAVGEAPTREHGSRYIDFLVPGLLGMTLMGNGIWGVGFAIVDARKKRLLKRLIATPMPRAHYLGSFLVLRLVLLVAEVTVLVGFGAIAFDVPVRGPVVVLAAISLLGSLAFSAMGLLLASRARTIEAASGLMNLAMVPMWIFSGVFFSSANFPQALQPAIAALPLTAVNDALRANMLEGAGLAQVAGELGVIAAWLVVCFAAALRIFRWQ